MTTKLQIFFAKNDTNVFRLLSDTNFTSYHSDWSCDLCYCQNSSDTDFKTIIITYHQYRRVCSECISNGFLYPIFGNDAEKIEKILKLV